MCFFGQFKINRLTKKLKNMQRARLHNQPTDVVLKNEILLYHRLASLCSSLEGKRNFPFVRDLRECAYRAAAMLDDSSAQYLLGKQFLEEGKYRETLQAGEVFASNSNEEWMKRLYQEAHAFLQAAEGRQHIQAKRLRGLALINGWGVSIDKNKGFELVLASVDQEGSWDKIPEIFKEIGLNKPEFFEALAKHRNENNSQTI